MGSRASETNGIATKGVAASVYNARCIKVQNKSFRCCNWLASISRKLLSIIRRPSFHDSLCRAHAKTAEAMSWGQDWKFHVRETAEETCQASENPTQTGWRAWKRSAATLVLSSVWANILVGHDDNIIFSFIYFYIISIICFNAWCHCLVL